MEWPFRATGLIVKWSSSSEIRGFFSVFFFPKNKDFFYLHLLTLLLPFLSD